MILNAVQPIVFCYNQTMIQLIDGGVSMAIKVNYHKLREVREELNYTRPEVAEALKWKVERLVNVEDGSSGKTEQTIAYIEQLCDYYNIDRTSVINLNYRPTKVITFGSGKGGTGKTTTCCEVIWHLAKTKKILAIDGDPQGNLSKMLGFTKVNEDNLNTLLCTEEKDVPHVDIKKFIVPSRLPNVDAITFSPGMYAADRKLNMGRMPLGIFRRIKDSLIENGEYDYVLIDTSFQISTYILGLIIMSDKFYVPLDLAPFTIDALPTFFDALVDAQVYKSTIWPGEKFSVDGIIRTRVDYRKLIAKEVDTYLKDNIPYPILEDYVPNFTTMEQAQYASQFIEEFDNKSANAKKIIKAYEKIAKEVAR